MMMTDVRTKKPPELAQGRNYAMASPPTDENAFGDYLIKILQHTDSREKGFLVLDGGANRRSFDMAIAFLSGIILIPTGSGSEEMDVAEADYFEMKRFIEKNNLTSEVFIVLNRWPGEARKRVVLESKPRIKDKIAFWEERGMLFPEIFNMMPSFVEIADDQSPSYTLLIDTKAREFAEMISGRLGAPLQGAKEAEPDGEEQALAAEIQGLASETPGPSAKEDAEPEEVITESVFDNGPFDPAGDRPVSPSEVLRQALLDQLKLTPAAVPSPKVAKSLLRKTA